MVNYGKYKAKIKSVKSKNTKVRSVSISEMRMKNKEAGRYFFEKGNPPIISRKGNIVTTKGYGGGKVDYEYDHNTGKFKYLNQY